MAIQTTFKNDLLDAAFRGQTYTGGTIPTSGTIVAFGVYDDGVLIDEDTLSTPFTPDVTNNELEINYTFAL